MSTFVSGVGGSWAPQAMSGASKTMPPAQKMSNIFSQLTTPGSGVLTKGQFTQAFNTMNPTSGFRAMGVDAVFSALDRSGSGSVSRPDFIRGMVSLMTQFRTSSA